MNILILGSGGREHAFAYKIAQSPLCTRLFVATGNAGTGQVATNVAMNIMDFKQVGDFSYQYKIDMLVVGSEAPLVGGIADYFAAQPQLRHIKVIGAKKAGAMLEGSKDFAKQFMLKYNIPTATYRTFTSSTLAEGLDYIAQHSLPVVLKADGLAAGKGVIIAETTEYAQATLQEMLAGKFGEASRRVVIEQFLSGIELSVFILTDGISYKLLPSAKDYKRVGEGDKGLNTGGMGAVSPVPFADEAFMQKVKDKIIAPTLQGLQAEKIDYKGFIFFGLIKVGEEPYMIEYNARMGDPETEVVLPRIETDLVALLDAAAQQKLADFGELQINPQTATTVMLVSGGYPEDFEKDKVITGLEEIKDAIAFHAGTKLLDNKIVSSGGRVVALTAFGNTLQEALQKSNAAANTVNFDKKYYLKDIGFDLM
jgi:phosphoribosylamine--glycine ligase